MNAIDLLDQASEAVRTLTKKGIAVRSVHLYERAPVIVVENDERREAVLSGALFLSRTGQQVYAVRFLGCQVQWSRHAPKLQLIGGKR